MTTNIDNEDYFAEMKLMFQTKGWDHFIADLMENVEIINNLQDVNDEKDLYIKQGKLAAIGLIVNFPETIKRAEEEQDESLE